MREAQHIQISSPLSNLVSPFPFLQRFHQVMGGHIKVYGCDRNVSLSQCAKISAVFDFTQWRVTADFIFRQPGLFGNQLIEVDSFSLAGNAVAAQL